MKLDQNIANLIFELEEIIASECYNKHSVDGWTGIVGLEYRYPVHVRRHLEDKSGDVIRSRVSGDASAPQTMYYHFGANQLFIGSGITKLLELLEQRYDLNLNELEDNYISQFPNNLEYAKTLLMGKKIACKHFGTPGTVVEVYKLSYMNNISYIAEFEDKRIRFDYPESLLKREVHIID